MHVCKASNWNVLIIVICSNRMNSTRKSCVRATSIDAVDACVPHSMNGGCRSAEIICPEKMTQIYNDVFRMMGRCHDCTHSIHEELQPVLSIYWCRGIGIFPDADVNTANNAAVRLIVANPQTTISVNWKTSSFSCLQKSSSGRNSRVSSV